tara:strand:+ start:82 stop:1032 length:951 start_codon:yes stop_codon:yes gene_type:complete
LHNINEIAQSLRLNSDLSSVEYELKNNLFNSNLDSLDEKLSLDELICFYLVLIRNLDEFNLFHSNILYQLIKSKYSLGQRSSRKLLAGYEILIINMHDSLKNINDSKVEVLRDIRHQNFIGDSHTIPIFYAMREVTKNLSLNLFVGAKMWHLKELSSQIESCIFSQNQNKTTFWISFGEIDCRINEGIISYSAKSNQSIYQIADNTLLEFEILINSIFKFISHSTNFNIISLPDEYSIKNPIPSSNLFPHMNSEINSLRSILIKYININLKLLCNKYGCNFINYPISKIDFCDDKIHLSLNYWRNLLLEGSLNMFL